MSFIKLTTQADLPAADEAKEFPCGDKTICIANVNGAYSAMDNVCLHRGGPIGQGMIENGKVVCRGHGWGVGSEDRRGRAQCEREGRRDPMKIENGDVLIEM